MSFDDGDDMIPRNAPQPAPFIEATAKPTVPEVSLLFDQEKSNRFTNPNRSILKGSPASNSQQNKVDTNSTPIEPYNTWRWKGLSQQNANGISGAKHDIRRSPLSIENQHRDDSNFRNGHQSPTSLLQQQMFELPSRINFENHYNYQSTEPVQSKSHRSYGIHNLSDQCGHLQRQPEFNHRHEFSHRPTANSVQHCLSPQRLDLSTNNTISHFNKKPFQINSEPNKFEMYRPTNNTLPNYHSNNEPHLRSEPPQVNRSVYRPTVVHEGNKLYHDKGFNLDVSQNQEFRTSNSTNMIGIPAQNVCNSHDHSCRNHVISHHGVSNAQRSNPYTISHNTINNPLRCCNSVNCTQVDNQAFVKDMINIIQTQNVQILKLQDQINQLIQLHSNCHKSKDKVDVSVQFDSPNSYLGKGRRTKGSVLENLPVIEEQFDTMHIGAFQNGYSNQISVGGVTSDLTPVQLDSDKVNVPKNCHCDCKIMSSPTKIIETSPRSSNLKNVHVGCSNQDRPSSDRKGRHIRPNLTHHNEDHATMDRSFTLNEADLAIGTIAEQIPSPTSSVHVDMKEYNSSSYEDSCSSESSSGERDSTEPQVGWTFYDSVLGQVNNILNKKVNPSKAPPDSFDAVRNATIEHFRNMGISFTDIDNTISKKVTFDAKHSPQYDTDDKNETDITMHFNAVAMQCLKDELGTRYPDKMQDFMMCNVASGNANLSFATLRYLERYHLLPKTQDQMFQEQAATSKESHAQKMKKRKKKPKEADPTWYQPRKPTAKNSVTSKILDITTLKQQPKLL